MMKVIVVFKRLLASGNDQHGRPPSIQMGVTAGIFLASILLKDSALSSVYNISMVISLLIRSSLVIVATYIDTDRNGWCV